jgi:predicted RNA-binding protein
MSAHILLASEENFRVCVQRGVYGCVKPSTERNKAEIIAGILSIQPGDLAFFYVKNQGIHGLWKVVSEPYFDETRIWSDEQQAFPYRISLEPAVGHFPRPVSLIDVLDLHDKGEIWTFDLSPVQRKNQYKITMAEARGLLRLLLRNNPVRQPPKPLEARYTPAIRGKIDVELDAGEPGLGDYQEYLSLVPTTLNKVMDVFLTHVTTVDSIDVLHKYTCIELKVDCATEPDLAQILRYEKMLARKLASGDDEMIQSMLVGRRFADDIVEYVRHRQRVEEKAVRLVTYRVTDDRRDIVLEELPPA